MKTLVQTRTWLGAMQLFVEGKTISGAELQSLPGYEHRGKLDVDREYRIYGELDLHVYAARLAGSILDEDTAFAILNEALDMGIELDDFHGMGATPLREFRVWAWELGMAADFGARMKALAAC